jgi:hypothetical protein
MKCNLAGWLSSFGAWGLEGWGFGDWRWDHGVGGCWDVVGAGMWWVLGCGGCGEGVCAGYVCRL